MTRHWSFNGQVFVFKNRSQPLSATSLLCVIVTCRVHSGFCGFKSQWFCCLSQPFGTMPRRASLSTVVLNSLISSLSLHACLAAFFHNAHLASFLILYVTPQLGWSLSIRDLGPLLGKSFFSIQKYFCSYCLFHKKIYYISLGVLFPCMSLRYMDVFPMENRRSRRMELEVQTDVSHHVGSGNADRALNRCTISL